jgi:hypothetical protein
MLLFSSRALFSQEAAKACPSAPDLAEEVRNMAAALNLCPEFADFSNQKEHPGTLDFRPETYELTMKNNMALTKLQGGLNIAMLQYNAAALHESSLNLKKKLASQTELQIATAIIGIVGGGVGGGLHLVNNHQVAHDATLIGIGSGVLGGSLGLYSAFKYPPPDNSAPGGRVLSFAHTINEDLQTNAYKDSKRLEDVLQKSAFLWKLRITA